MMESKDRYVRLSCLLFGCAITHLRVLARWSPPVNIAFEASHTDFGGIVGSVALLMFDEETEKVDGSEVRFFLNTEHEMKLTNCYTRARLTWSSCRVSSKLHFG